MEHKIACMGIHRKTESLLMYELSEKTGFPLVTLEEAASVETSPIHLWFFDGLTIDEDTYAEEVENEVTKMKTNLAKLMDKKQVVEVCYLASIYGKGRTEDTFLRKKNELEEYLKELSLQKQVSVQIFHTPLLWFTKEAENIDIRCYLDNRIKDYVTWVKSRIPTYFEQSEVVLFQDAEEEVSCAEAGTVIETIVDMYQKKTRERITQYTIRCEETVSLLQFIKDRFDKVYGIRSRQAEQGEEPGMMNQIFNHMYSKYIPHLIIKQDASEIRFCPYQEFESVRQENESEVCVQKKSCELSNGKVLVYYTAGQGTPILIMNAYGVEHESWNPLVTLLAKDYYVVYWNTRGMYDVDKLGEDREYICGIADQVKDMEEVAAREKLSRFHLMSWCSGAKAAVFYNIYHPDKVISQIFVCGEFAPFEGSKPYHSKFRENIQMIAELINNNPKMLDFYMKIIHNGMFNRPIQDIGVMNGTYIYEIMPEKHRKCLLAPFASKETMVNFLNMCMEYYTHDVTELLGKIEVPVLFLSAECDQVAPYMQSKWAHEKVKNSKFSCLVSGTHLVILERTKDVYRLLCQHMKYINKTGGGEKNGL